MLHPKTCLSLRSSESVPKSKVPFGSTSLVKIIPPNRPNPGQAGMPRPCDPASGQRTPAVMEENWGRLKQTRQRQQAQEQLQKQLKRGGGSSQRVSGGNHAKGKVESVEDASESMPMQAAIELHLSVPTRHFTAQPVQPHHPWSPQRGSSCGAGLNSRRREASGGQFLNAPATETRGHQSPPGRHLLRLPVRNQIAAARPRSELSSAAAAAIATTTPQIATI